MKSINRPIAFLLAAGVMLPLALSYLWRYLAWSWPAPPASERQPPQCNEHQYGVEVVSQTPLIMYLDNFLTSREVTHFLALGYVSSSSLAPYTSRLNLTFDTTGSPISSAQ